MQISSLLTLTPMVALFVGGASTLKAYATGGQAWWLVLSVGLYGGGAFLMSRLLKAEGLGVTYAINNTLQLALLVGVGVLVFQEKLSLPQGIGAGLAIVAVALMALPGRTL